MSDRPSPEFPNGKFPPGLGFAGPTHRFPTIEEADKRRRESNERVEIAAFCFFSGIGFGVLFSLVFI